MSCIYSLTGLQDLLLIVRKAPLRIWDGLTALQSLTSLFVSSGRNQTQQTLLTLDVEWQHMHALEVLAVNFGFLSCCSSLLGLSRLQNLQHLTFESCRPQPYTPTCKYMCLLMYRLAKHQFHVRVHFDDEVG